MPFSTSTTEIGYLTNGSDTTFEIPFVYSHEDYIKVETYEEVTDPVTGETETVITPLVKDTDFQFVDEDTIETIVLVLGVPTPTALAADLTLRIYRDTDDRHATNYDTYRFPYQTVNADLDQVYQRLQELRRDVNRAISLNYLSLESGESLTGEEIIQAISDLEDLIESMSTGAGLPTGGEDGDFIERRVDPVTSAESGEWVSGSYDGYSLLTGGQFTSTGLKDTLDKIIRITYTPAAITLSATPAQSIREKGDTVAAVTLNATTTKRSDPISEVRFYRAGVLINTVNPADADGGLESYISAAPFADTMSFYAQVTDNGATGGPTSTTSNTVTYSYVYPYYYGSGVPALAAASVAALTKSIIASTASLNRTFTPSNGDVFYYAYPASYGALSSILDENGFETFSDWTLRTENITGLDGNPVSYRIYEFNNPVIAGTTNYTFIR